MGRPPARRGAGPIVEAAAEVLARADLDALVTGAVPTREVAARAGVSPGTISHHFPTDDEVHGETRLPRAAAEAALEVLRDEAVQLDDRVLDALEVLDGDDRDAAVQAIVEVVEGDAPHGTVEPARDAAVVALLLHAATAPHDDRARARLADVVDDLVTMRAEMVEASLTSLRRRMAAGWATTDLARLLLAVREGLRLLDRAVPPDDAATRRYAASTLRVFAALTEPDDDAARVDAITSLLPLPDQPALRGAALDRVRRAARALYDEGGWPRVTLARLSRRTGVSRANLVAHFGDRHGLAGLVWSRHLPTIDRAATRSRGDATGRMGAVLQAIAEAATDDRDLTSAFLHGVFAHTAAHGPPNPASETDPRVMVPLPRVVERVLADTADAMDDEWVATTEGRRDAAAMLNNDVLLLTVTRPHLTPEEVARRVLVTTYAGMRGA